MPDRRCPRLLPAPPISVSALFSRDVAARRPVPLSQSSLLRRRFLLQSLCRRAVFSDVRTL